MSSLEVLKDHPLWPFREDYVNFLSQVSDEVYNLVDENDTITLYHGTTTEYLNKILAEGLLPRQVTGTSNWELESAEKFTYLTNKWHYYYAYRANEEVLVKKFGEDYIEQPEGRWWQTLDPLPCYIECKIPKALLFADEDMFLTTYMYKKLKTNAKKAEKAGEEDVAISVGWEESLAQYGTAAVYGGVPAKYIHSFTVLGEPTMYLDMFDENKSYLKDFRQWQSGKGKGKRFDMMKMLERETHSDLNGTWWLKEFKGRIIHKFVINPSNGKLAIHFVKR